MYIYISIYIYISLSLSPPPIIWLCIYVGIDSLWYLLICLYIDLCLFYLFASICQPMRARDRGTMESFSSSQAANATVGIFRASWRRIFTPEHSRYLLEHQGSSRDGQGPDIRIRSTNSQCRGFWDSSATPLAEPVSSSSAASMRVPLVLKGLARWRNRVMRKSRSM